MELIVEKIKISMIVAVSSIHFKMGSNLILHEHTCMGYLK